MNHCARGPLLSADEQAELARAVHALEHASFAVRLAELAGQPVRRLFRASSFANRRVNRLVEVGIMRCLDVAIGSMDGEVPDKTPSAWVPRAIAGLTGGLGGLFGVLALPVELPLTTMIMLRSIAEIAQSYGEDLNCLQGRLACVEVFALGGQGAQGGQSPTYYATRATLAKLTSDVANSTLKQGTARATSTVTAGVAATISARFGPAMAERVVATAVPLVGLLGGATVNMLFMEHYQRLAHGHFVIRRLERRYGGAEIAATYARIAATARKS